jgi:hypothetical protein
MAWSPTWNYSRKQQKAAAKSPGYHTRKRVLIDALHTNTSPGASVHAALEMTDLALTVVGLRAQFIRLRIYTLVRQTSVVQVQAPGAPNSMPPPPYSMPPPPTFDANAPCARCGGPVQMGSFCSQCGTRCQ